MTAPPTRSPLPGLPRRAAPCRGVGWLVAALLLLPAGCGGEGGDENADPARVAPQGTLFYGVATIRPAGDQGDAVAAIGRKVLRTENPGERIQQELDRRFREDPETRETTYEQDIEPWLGRRVAVALTQLGPGGQAQGAVIIASKDNGKAKDTIEQGARDQRAARRTHNGVTYYYDAADTTAAGVVGDYVVIGTEPALRSVVDASKAAGLDQKRDFRSAASDAEDRLGFGYFDLNALVSALNASGQVPPGQAQAMRSLLGAGSHPVTMSLDAQPDRLALDLVARGVPRRGSAEPPTELVSALPGDSWLALGAELRESIRQLTSQLGGTLEAAGRQLRAQTGLDLHRDVLPALGDMALFLRGSSLFSLGAGAVIKSADPAAARRLVARLGSLIEREAGGGLRSASTTIAGARGIRIASPRMPGAVNAVVRGDTLVIAYGDEATRQAFVPASRLDAAPEYRAARASLGGSPPAVFVAFGPIAELVGTQASPRAQQARTYLSGLRTLAAASRREGDTQTARVVLTVR